MKTTILSAFLPSQRPPDIVFTGNSRKKGGRSLGTKVKRKCVPSTPVQPELKKQKTKLSKAQQLAAETARADAETQRANAEAKRADHATVLHQTARKTARKVRV